MIPEGEFRDQGGPLRPHRPWWFTALLILLVAAGFLAPFLMTAPVTDSMLETLLKLFPVYMLVSAVCAWLCYPQRKPLAWILVVLMLMSSASLCLI